MKDYYDIYYLANKFDFDGETLTEAMKKTFSNRGRNFTVEQFEQMISFTADENMQKKWTAFRKKVNAECDFDSVLEIIRKFLSLPYQVMVSGGEYTKTWFAGRQIWN